MNVFTFSEARQKLAAVLAKAKTEGEVRIKRKNGDEFTVKLVRKKKSPLDVKGISLGLSAEEIVEAVKESRERPGH